jgi:hypothetical protein
MQWWILGAIPAIIGAKYYKYKKEERKMQNNNPEEQKQNIEAKEKLPVFPISINSNEQGKTSSIIKSKTPEKHEAILNGTTIMHYAII